MFILIEMSNGELTSVLTFQTKWEALDVFDSLTSRNVMPIADEGDLANELTGTIAIAGDDIHSVQVIDRKITQIHREISL